MGDSLMIQLDTLLTNARRAKRGDDFAASYADKAVSRFLRTLPAEVFLDLGGIRGIMLGTFAAL